MTTAQKTPPTPRGQRTRKLILERTAQVFDQQGYAGATLSQLVESTGLTRGAFYFHFESKDELAASIAEKQAERWQQLLVQVEGQERNPLRRLVMLLCESAFAYRDDATVRAASRLLLDRGLIQRELPRTAPWWRETIARLLQQAQTDGLIRDLSFLRRSGSPPGADADDVSQLAEYLVSQLAAIGQAAISRPDSQFDLLYVQWAMVLPRICASAQDAEEVQALVRDLLGAPRHLEPVRQDSTSADGAPTGMSQPDI